MIQENQILAAISRIYGAVGDAKVWSIFLDEFASVIDCHAAVLIATNLRTGDGKVLASAGIDPEFLASYGEYYGDRDPWLPSFVKLPKGKFLPTEARVPSSELVRTEFYNDWLRPQGFYHSFGGVLLREGDEVVLMGLPRRAAQAGYSNGDLNCLRVLAPHIERALQLETRLSQNGLEHRASLAALDHSAHGFVLVDDRMRVLTMNDAAHAIVASDDGLTVRDCSLRAFRVPEDAALQKLVADAIQTTRKMAFASGGVTAITRPSGLRPFTLLVTPLPRNGEGIFAERAAAAIFVKDPEKKFEPQVETLQRLYGLTPAEARLAQILATGLSLAEAAERLRITRETARSRLKRIYSKTDTHRQAELVRLLVAT